MTMTAPMLGSVGLSCPPRFATPRDLSRATLGPQVGEVSMRLGRPLMPWQQLVADVAFELDDDGRFVYDEVDITVPRQSGKTALIMAKTVFRLVRLPASHGPQRSTYTAQTRHAARKKLEQDFAEVLRRSRASFTEITNVRARPSRPTQWKLSLNNGSEHIRFGTQSYWQIDATSSDSGHGDTLDDGTIDEAFAHLTDDIEGAMRPAQATRADAQLWVLSTAGHERSVYLYRKVLAGREACESGEHGSVAYFEWSAPDDADYSDPDVWRACSPALGFTIDESFLHTEWERAQRKGQEGVDTFRRAYLNQWPAIPVLGESDQWVIPRDAWADTLDDDSDIEGVPAFALEVAEDRSWSAFGAAGPSTVADAVHGVVVDYRRGTAWVVERAGELVGKWGGEVVVAKGSPAASMIKALTVAGVPVREVSTEHLARACGELLDAVVEGRFRHRDQAPLNIAVRGAVKRDHGDAWVWSRRRSEVDISPLVAVTLAVGAYGAHVEVDPLSQIE